MKLLQATLTAIKNAGGDINTKLNDWECVGDNGSEHPSYETKHIPYEMLRFDLRDGFVVHTQCRRQGHYEKEEKHTEYTLAFDMTATLLA